MTAATSCWQLQLNFITTSTLLKYLNLIPPLRVYSFLPALTAVTAVASFARCYEQLNLNFISRSLHCKMSGPLTLGPARGTWTRCRRSSWEKVAGSRTREVLEKGGEGALSRNCPRLAIIQNWIRQTRLDQNIYLSQCFSAIIFITVP